ncbi:MAG: hypothetical protein PVG90_10150 [Bacillota bacterium]|jgi:hypothetical protein
MTANVGNYTGIVETICCKDGTVRKVGFREGRWIVKRPSEKVAVSKCGYLLYLECEESGRAYAFRVFVDFAEMAAAENEMDYLLLGEVAAALGADYIAFLDD